MVRPTEEEKDL